MITFFLICQLFVDVPQCIPFNQVKIKKEDVIKQMNFKYTLCDTMKVKNYREVFSGCQKRTTTGCVFMLRPNQDIVVTGKKCQ